MIGHVQGGWEFIWSAYFLSWAGIAVFAISLVPSGPRQRASQSVIGGGLSLFAGIVLAALGASTGDPVINRTALTVVSIGVGVVLLSWGVSQLAQNRRKETAQ